MMGVVSLTCRGHVRLVFARSERSASGAHIRDAGRFKAAGELWMCSDRFPDGLTIFVDVVISPSNEFFDDLAWDRAGGIRPELVSLRRGGLNDDAVGVPFGRILGRNYLHLYALIII
jgi:hypothetical protein